MIVVSDTSPLNYLVLIGAVESLPKLFDGVFVPPSIIAELTRAETPNEVRATQLLDMFLRLPPPCGEGWGGGKRLTTRCLM